MKKYFIFIFVPVFLFACSESNTSEQKNQAEESVYLQILKLERQRTVKQKQLPQNASAYTRFGDHKSFKIIQSFRGKDETNKEATFVSFYESVIRNANIPTKSEYTSWTWNINSIHDPGAAQNVLLANQKEGEEMTLFIGSWLVLYKNGDRLIPADRLIPPEKYPQDIYKNIFQRFCQGDYNIETTACRENI